MGPVRIKMVDSKGRVSLGKEFAGGLVMIRKMADGVLQVVRAEAVPAKEVWLHNSPKAISAVLAGLEQARRKEFAESPDLDAGSALVEKIEGT